MIAEYLTMQGFTVLQAANGLEGLLHVQRSAPRVVILDLRMPRLGGIEALKLIRRFDPTIVVIVISAGVDADIAREAIAQGARAVLAKPLDLNRLAAVLPAPDAAVSSAQVAAPSRPSPPTVSGVPASAPRAPARVLVVDDEPRVRSLLAETRFWERGVRLAGVSLQKLVPVDAGKQMQFEFDARGESTSPVVDRIKSKFGEHAIGLARTLEAGAAARHGSRHPSFQPPRDVD